MADTTSLLDRLDAADDDAREHIWASASTLLTPADIQEAARQRRPCLPWLVLRYDAGPPGRALPDALRARSGLLRGKGAAADAYAAAFTGPAVTDTAEALPLLLNATAAVFSGPGGWFGGWLASRAALAWIAGGQPDRAWELLDALTQEGRRHPEIEKVAVFLPLRGHPELATSALVRAAVCWLWPQLRVPAIPALPWPSRGAEDLAATLDRLEEVGAGKVLELALAFLHAVEKVREDDRSADPLVSEIERRALACEGPPAVSSLPQWFPDWARAQGRGERLPVAYLAGQLLHAQGHPDKALVGMLIWRLARTGDLPILRSCFEEGELVALLSELEEASVRLSPRLGDALIAVALPNHAHSTEAIGALLGERDALDVLRPQPGGVVAHVVGMVREIAESRARDHAEVRPLVEALWAEVRRVADRLGDVRQLSVADVERATRGVAAPPISLGLLELSQDIELPPLGRLLQALVLLQAVRGTPHEPTWGPALRKDASTAIWHLGVVRLFELRIRLLDELIADPGPLASVAELHFQRANSRRALQVHGDGVATEVADDLVTAIEHARRAGELVFLADALGMLARVLADEPDEARDSRQVDVLAQVDEVLALPLPPERQASLLQAKAHLVRRRDPALAATWIEEAVPLLNEADPYRWEIGAEYVLALVDAGRTADAVAQGRGLLGEVTERATDTVIAMAHHALGYAFEHQGAWGEARREYERALDRVRGVDWRNEAATRLRLARIALALSDRELWSQQHQVLDERAGDLSAVMLSDLAQLTAEAAHRGMAPHEEATATLVKAESRSPAAGAAALQRARLGLDRGEEVDLGGVMQSALESAGSNVDAVLEPILDMACNHGDLLEVPLLRTLATLARERRRPAAEARLLDHLGEAAAACAVLEGALAGHLPKRERAACTHLLVTLLGDDRTEDRLGRCQELEALLAENDSPTARIDLASSYRLMAQGDRQLLERAWVHGAKALPRLRAGTERAHGHRVVALIVADLVHAGIGKADSELAERARWLLDELPIPAKELAEIRHAVAHNLLVLGPLCPPATVDVAVRLLALATQGEHAPAGVPALQGRASWIQDVTAAEPTGRPRPLDGGPADGLPNWLIRLVAGHRERPNAADLAAGLDAVALAIRVRPDAADRVLSTLVRRQGMFSEKARAALFELVLREVSGPTIGDGAWAELEAAMQSHKSKNRPRHTTAIEAEIQRARDGAPRAPAGKPPPRATGSPEYARSAFDRAVALMRFVHAEPFAEDAAERIQEARQLLADAVAIARRKNMPEESDFLISLGNAWKMPPDEDVDRALAIYEKVGRRQLHASQIPKLQKVRGDALRRRGRPDDLREAFDLLRKSARARVGWDKAESLLNAAGVARQHPDFDERQRLVRAAELMLDAARADANHVEDALEDLLMLLGEWESRTPTDERPKAIREELRRRYPGRSSDIDLPARLPPASLREHVLAMLTHPAGRAYIETASKLMQAEQMVRDPFWLRGRFGKSAEEKVGAELTRKSLLSDPDGITRALAELDAGTHEAAAVPGVALARVRLLAELCRSGKENLDTVRLASHKARAEIDRLPDPIVRAFLTREHARIWCPHDHSGDRVRDFALSAELARDAMALEGGQAQATTDTLELVARALRYSPRGDIGANLAECRRLYALLVERARAEGNADLAANAMHCLADAESQGADGDRLSRLRAGEAHIEASVRGASNPYKRAEYVSSLAWQRTQIALQLQDHEQVEALRSALASFDEVDLSFLDEGHERQNHRLNRAVCHGALERATKGRRAEVEVWRTELTAAEGEGHAHLVATMQHNLANALMIGSDVGPREIAEGLDLCERAVRVRTLEANARHHWETTLLAGMGLSRALAAAAKGAAIELPWSPPLTWEKARGWFRKAVRAAKTLGTGEELADAASWLARLARLTPSTRDAIDVAEEGWSAMREAMPYLLFHPDTALQESMGALELALGLGWNLARQGPWVAPPGIAFVMEGDRAQLVLRWLLRGFAPLRRPLTARLQRPANVGLDLWTSWQGALDARDPVALAGVLKTVRAAAPEFLSADLTLAPTWRWLRGRPGAVAITIILAQPVSLAVVLSVDVGGRERVQVLGVPAPPPPVSDEALWGAFSQSTSPDSGGFALHDTVAEWARKALVEPILRWLGAPPAAVLWCPGQTLRMVSPSAIWRKIPVATTAALALPDLASAPPRGRSTLVVLADPGKEPLGLDGAGQPAAQRLVDTSSSRGDTSALVSVGERHGPSLGVARTVTGPASPANLLRRARDHDVLVIVAHGEAQTPESAALLLLDEAGEVQRLDVAKLAAHPGAFTGATVILLACESGRVGAGFHEPGGVAGALVAAGARAVIAPLWPVRLDVAEAVAEAVLRGVAAGEEPFEVLARVQAGGDGRGAMLGPAPALNVQNQASGRHRQAFVSWVG